MTDDPMTNLVALKNHSYPGRGIIIGRDVSGKHYIQMYLLTGRSPGSQNRVLTRAGNQVFTELADPMQDCGNTSLTLYNAMSERDKWAFVVSNGDQTDAVMNALEMDHGFERALATRQYEPDAPHYTPRITALLSFRGERAFKISVLRKALLNNECERRIHTYNLDAMEAGRGYCVTTYASDGNPLPSFRGLPYKLPLSGKTIDELTDTFWNILNGKNMVSLVVKFINARNGESTVRIKNKFAQVQTAASVSVAG